MNAMLKGSVSKLMYHVFLSIARGMTYYLLIFAKSKQMSGKFGILTGESLQNLKFCSVGHWWDYTVTCLVVPNIGHIVQCRSLFVALLMIKQYT